jgi:hypothetical protein
MEKVQVHIDTSDTSNVTGGQSRISKNNGNPFECTYRFSNQNLHASSINLQMAEIPKGFYNVRSPFNQLTLGGTLITITPGNYNTLSDLATAITSQYGQTVSLNSTNGIATLGLMSPATLGPATYNSLLWFLGFRHTATQTTGTSFRATAPYTLAWDTYISVFIENVGTSSPENSQITFKIPLSTISNGGIFWTENTQNKQSKMFNSATRLSYLNITFYDRFGNILNNNGLDWSMSLDIDFVNRI